MASRRLDKKVGLESSVNYREVSMRLFAEGVADRLLGDNVISGTCVVGCRILVLLRFVIGFIER